MSTNNQVTKDLEYLRELLKFLKDKGIKIYIVSRGYVNLEPIEPDFIYNVLKHGELLNYFDGIYGCLSEEQKGYELPLKILREIDNMEWAQIKSMIIENVIKKNNFNRKRVLFVDDTPLNLGYASINNHIITYPIQGTSTQLKGIDMLKEGVFGENFNENSTIVSNNYYNYPEGENYQINLNTHNIISKINITYLNKIMELQNSRLKKR